MKVSPTEEERSLVPDSRAVGNRAPDKRKAMYRIDSTVALVMVSRWRRSQAQICIEDLIK
jgi:hypothetical protein